MFGNKREKAIRVGKCRKRQVRPLKQMQVKKVLIDIYWEIKFEKIAKEWELFAD